MFNWFLDCGLQKDNKISYLSCGEHTRNIETNKDQQQNFIATGGNPEYRAYIPYNNFEDRAEIPVDNDGRIKKTMPLYDCLFNIVSETRSTSGYAMHTEKSMNTVLYGHVPIIVGGPGSMKKLQDMGMIIPDYILWSTWDELEMGQLNQDKIAIMQRQLIDLFSRHSIEDIAVDWYPYALRNLNKFNELEQNCAREEREICRWILCATHNLSNPRYQGIYN
jgi:hypothetical protein